MPIFVRDHDNQLWSPTPKAAGLFAGLHGGAVAGLLTGEVESLAAKSGWGFATSVAAWFIRPAPMAPMRTEIRILSSGGRVTVVDNVLRLPGQDEVIATARVTLIKHRPLSLPEAADQPSIADPTRLQAFSHPSPHGKPWFMDAMDVRVGPQAAWFRSLEPLIDGAGPLARIVGPADWAHGIRRPAEQVAADPNPNLTVHISRPPVGDWLGIDAATTWRPDSGIGTGRGVLLDVEGEIGTVSMAVALAPLKR